ncbi:PP2C family protein-serine/threonine phosphatase [Isoptericola chiayiensis]|uniref:PP2C family protein-serine/threonine phosphatase n=1 Tax=Isoptericola chiayiensis TaxID=579446 RepID=UPI0031EB4451
MSGDAWERAPLGLLRLDADGYVVAANETFVGWQPRCAGSQSPAEVPGRRIGDLLTVGGRIYWDTHVAPALALAGSVEAVALEVRTVEGPLPVLLTAATDTADGTAAGTVHVALLAVRERAEFHQELVRARLAAERWADRLHWLQDATAGLSRAAGTAQVRRALVDALSRHPAVAEVRLSHPGDTARATVRRTGASTFEVGVAGAAGSHGVLRVRVHDRPGDLPVDVDALDVIAQQGGVALDRARMHEQSASVAHELQHAMLTVDLPRHPGLRLTAHYRPAEQGLEVGGDWYDAFWLKPTRLAVVVGDVVGHGLQAATAMGQLRTAVRALAVPGRGPAAVVDLVHGFVVDRHVGFGSTLVYGELDLATSRFTFACAGHLPPLHVQALGGCAYCWQGRSTPLGVPAPVVRAQGTIDLDAGDTVVLFTDGVVERRDQSLPEGLNALASAAVAHTASPSWGARLVASDGDARDDACVLAVTWRPVR